VGSAGGRGQTRNGSIERDADKGQESRGEVFTAATKLVGADTTIQIIDVSRIVTGYTYYIWTRIYRQHNQEEAPATKPHPSS